MMGEDSDQSYVDDVRQDQSARQKKNEASSSTENNDHESATTLSDAQPSYAEPTPSLEKFKQILEDEYPELHRHFGQ
jgi:hypothetical protein